MRLWCLILVLMLGGVPALYLKTSPLSSPQIRDPNESWNASLVMHLVHNEPLYGGQPTNNYPPLSFEVLAVAVRAGAEPVTAGRALSLLSLLVTITCFAGALLRLGVSSEGAALAAVLCVASLLLYSHYVGICDPQFFAHAVSSGALLLALRGQLITSGALFAVSLLIKHNLVALPLAVAAMLAREHRAKAWSVSFVVALVGGLALARLHYGAPFFVGLATPRAYVVGDAAWAAVKWVSKLSPLIALSVWGRTRNAAFEWFGALAIIGFVVGCVAQGGAGVDSNALFECIFGVAVCAALAVERSPRWLFMALCIVPFGYGVVRHAIH